jgi:asparagine synthase (glutamine-hydrolysing)
MCGIVGIFNYKTGCPVDPQQLSALNQSLHHRGPDQEGSLCEGPLGLAMKRLSIIDLQTGRQPISNEDQSVWTVFNGEIYNYRALRKTLQTQGHSFQTTTDTEVLVHLYEEAGEKLTEQLNGMYSFAIWDKRRKRLLLARDPSGIKPLYVADLPDGVAFASEPKALLLLLNRADEDPVAIDAYLQLGYIPSTRTGFQQIRKVRAGTVELYESGMPVHVHPFDGYAGIERQAHTADDFISLFGHVLQRQLISDAPLGLLLSGGVDSSLIASVCALKLNIRPTCFTIRFADASYDEGPAALETAAALGIPIEPIVLDGHSVAKEIDQIVQLHDEPLMDYSTIPTYWVTRVARQRVKVLLAGDGGDELFGGYPTHYLPALVRHYRRAPSMLRSSFSSLLRYLPASHGYLSLDYRLRRFSQGAGPDPILNHLAWKELFRPDERALLGVRSDSPGAYAEACARQWAKEAERAGASLEEQLMHIDFRMFLQEDCLQKSDRMSMANGIEIRVPFLDNEVIEFARSLPARDKIRPFQTKRLLRDALERILPTGIAKRPKRGFTPPLASWINSELKEYVRDTLRTHYSGEAWTLIEKDLRDHAEGKAENSRRLWSLLILGSWRSRFLKSA